MAAGIPTTGIGGIFYIILLIGMLIWKLLKKTFAMMKLGRKEILKRMRWRFPTFAFIICIVLLIFMNTSGFRFITFVGPTINPVLTNNFWIITIIATGVLLTVILLLNRKASL